MTDASSAAYEEIAYPSVPYPQTHPSRLAVLASLFGLQPAPVERCRILDLGGGDGGNLIPMALGLPDAELVGIDLAAGPIARGQQTVQALGLTNVSLHCQDLRELAHLPAPDRPFDYIVAHGVYSWVPPDARRAVLQIIRRRLAPQGVAFISYNAYPGGHRRQMASEMLRYHTAGLADGREAITRAQELAHLLADALPEGDEHATARADLQAIVNRHPAALFHDELSPVTRPFYFHEVVEQAAAYGLQYLAEADFWEMQDYAFSPEVREMLSRIEQERGRIAREQYLDFLKGRQFRQTLLCHADRPLTRIPVADDVRHFLVGSPIRADSEAPDLHPGAVEQFYGQDGTAIQFDLPLAKAAFLELRDAWPDRLTFDELARRSARRLTGIAHPHSGADDARTVLTDVLWGSFRAGLVQLATWKPTLTAQPGPRPRLSPLARLQIERDDSPVISTLLHEFVLVNDPLARHLLRLLDGTRDRSALLSSLRAWVRHQSPQSPGMLSTNDEITSEGVELKLRELARVGLLID